VRNLPPAVSARGSLGTLGAPQAVGCG
jgi:hypothetical protein